MNFKYRLGVVGASFLFLHACAKDRSVDDYLTAKRQEQSARLKSVQGTYGGSLTRSDGSVLPMILELSSWSQVSNNDQISSLVGSLAIADEENSVAFSGGNFDRNSNEISLRISLSDQRFAELNGQLTGPENQTITGKIKVRSELSIFKVQRGSPPIELERSKTAPISSLLIGSLIEEGQATLAVRLQILEQLVTPEQKNSSFLSLRRKTVMTTLTVGRGDIILSFPDCEFDTKTHTLQGKGINRFYGTETSLACNPDGASWSCVAITAGLGAGAQFLFKQIP